VWSWGATVAVAGGDSVSTVTTRMLKVVGDEALRQEINKVGWGGRE